MNRFLTDLAVEHKVAAPTQNQALCALLFLYGRVLGQPLGPRPCAPIWTGPPTARPRLGCWARPGPLARCPGAHVHRHHQHPTVIQKALRQAARRTGIAKHVTPHVLRHSFASHLLDDGYDIRTVQELLGHDDVRTTMIYAHVPNRGGLGVRSPLEGLGSSVAKQYPAPGGRINTRGPGQSRW